MSHVSFVYGLWCDFERLFSTTQHMKIHPVVLGLDHQISTDV